MKHHYDAYAASAARGRARIGLLERTQDRVTPDPPEPKESLAHSITKKIEKASDYRNRKTSLSERNTGYCKPCRRIFDGAGNFALPMSKNESGLYYTHWDARYLKKSALRGCPLCLLIYRALDDDFIALTRGEVLPARYDYGKFGFDENIYALRFFYHTVLHNGEDVVPVKLRPVVITMQGTSAIGSLTTGAVVTTSTQSQESLEQILEWLKACNTSHSCSARQPTGSAPFLPTRLIDVGTSAGPECVRLVESKHIPLDSRYITLSHCWGPRQAMGLELTDQFESHFKETIPRHQLPKTIADAIFVARGLGLRYIWIDSLCIIQDNRDDWRREASMMWEVYSNSYLTVSASASADATQGLFRERPLTTTRPCLATVKDGHPLFAPSEYCCYDQQEWARYVDGSPLNKRAWVCQERLLSPRIVHFAADQIFWECHQLQASEGFPGGIPPRYSTEAYRQLFHSPGERERKAGFSKIWDSILRTYTDRNLTKNSDKLIAVSALAKELSRSSSIAGTYLAGLWKGLIIDQLLWSASPSTVRSPVYRAPTWSWASMDGPIFPNFNWSEMGPDGEKQRSWAMAEVLDATIVPEGDLFDSVSSGVLRLSGPLLKVTLRADDLSPRTIFDQLPEASLRLGINIENGVLISDDSRQHRQSLEPRGFYMDLLEDSEAKGRLDDDRSLDDPQNLFFMPILSFDDDECVYGEESTDISTIQGLILEPTKAEVGQFRRCGTCSVNEYDAGKLFCDLGNQNAEELSFESRATRKLTLEDFLPPKWSGKDLDFIPKEFDCYVISII